MSVVTETAFPALWDERAALIEKVNTGDLSEKQADPLLSRAWAIEEAILTAPTTSPTVAQYQLRLVADTFDKGPLTSRSDAVALTAVLAFLVRWGPE